MKILITDQIAFSIQTQRKKLHMSQTVLARRVGISQQTLQRIENRINKKCEKEILKQIYYELNLDVTEITGNELNIKSYRLPQQLIFKLEETQKSLKISNETQTLIYCLESYFADKNIKEMRYEIQQMIEETIVKTFAKEMKKMKRDIEKYESVLAMIEKNEGIDVKAYIIENETNLYKKIHAERMK